MKYKSVIGFLLVVAVVASLWFISKYKDTYQEEVLFTISFKNIPNDLTLNSNAQQIELPVEIRASGFTLIWEKLFGHRAVLDFKENTYSRSDSLFFNFSKSIKKIKRSKAFAYEILSADDLEIPLKFERFKSKRVPLINKVELEYTQNYLAIKKPYFNRDSVTITGNDDKINSLKEILVSQESKLIINDSLTTLEIDLKGLNVDLNYVPQRVLLTVEAAQMTEGKIQVPVQLINVPSSYNVKVIPDNVQVVFSTAVSNFNKVNEKDFNVLLDYNLIKDLNIAATPNITTSNDAIVSYRMNPKQVQVLTIK
ncbi:MAG: hypothetical protein ABF274_12115 [Nonlabens sp.]|uniref:hypothetical protein n=1 Tax=Nonlabens sp. TaxID=1888209 RepID=UPI00321B4A95